MRQNRHLIVDKPELAVYRDRYPFLLISKYIYGEVYGCLKQTVKVPFCWLVWLP